MSSATAGPATASPGIRRGVVVSAVGYALPLLASLATAPILAHQLGVVGRGELAAATAPFLLVITAATLGMPESLTYHVASRRATARRLATHGTLVLTGMGLVAGALIVLLAPWFAAGALDVARIITASAIAVVPALWVGGLRGLAAGRGAWTLITAERGVTAAVRLVGIAVLALTGHLTLWTAAAVLVAAPVLGGLAYARLPARLASLPAPETEEPLRRVVDYGARVWLGSLTGILLMRLDQAVFAPLSSAYELGLYAAAVAVSEIPLVVNSAVRTVIFTSDSSERDDDRLTAAARLTGLVCVGLGLLIAAALPVGLPLAFGADFAPALGPALVLVVAVVVGIPGSVAGSGLSSRGRPGLRSTSIAIACVVNAALLVVLLPSWGAMGAAVATLAGNLVSSNLNIVWFRRYFGVPMRAFFGVRRSDLTHLRRLVPRGSRHGR